MELEVPLVVSRVNSLNVEANEQLNRDEDLRRTARCSVNRTVCEYRVRSATLRPPSFHLPSERVRLNRPLEIRVEVRNDILHLLERIFVWQGAC